MNTIEYRNKLSESKGKLSLLQNQLDENKVLLEVNKRKLIAIEEAQIFIQQVAKATQEQLIFHVEDVVNLALNSLFPDEYVFSMKFDIKYGKTSANLIFMKEGFPIDILKAAGGGVVDIASLALRIAVWSLSKSEDVLILDEPVRNIQPASLQATAWEIIKRLSKRLHLQFIIVSNSSNNGEAINQVADKVYLIKKGKETIRDEEWDISRAEVIG